jgi:hypothetical protein
MLEIIDVGELTENWRLSETGPTVCMSESTWSSSETTGWLTPVLKLRFTGNRLKTRVSPGGSTLVLTRRKVFTRPKHTCPGVQRSSAQALLTPHCNGDRRLVGDYPPNDLQSMGWRMIQIRIDPCVQPYASGRVDTICWDGGAYRN